MIVYQNLEDSLYNVLEGLFPNWRIVFMLTNSEEQQTPYTVIDVRKIDPIGREYQSSMATIDQDNPDTARTVTIQDNLASIRFEVIGKNDSNTTAAEMANELQLKLRTPKGYELLARNNLAIHGFTSTRRIPVKRDTDTYMVYQIDCTMAYSVVNREEIDWIEITGLHATYYDAGREPDHIISHEIDLTPPK